MTQRVPAEHLRILVMTGVSAALIGSVGGCRRMERGDGLTIVEACLTPGSPPVWDLARAELCNNGIDDDQNGLIDEDCTCVVGEVVDCYPGWPAPAGVGICAWGRGRCVAAGPVGAWAGCVGAGMPAPADACNGLDDDCDRTIDEGCPCELGDVQPCFTGAVAAREVGACADGAQECVPTDSVDGVLVPGWGTCVGSTSPTTELCNGIDDDCDGVVDDLTELCDLVDDDCDGIVDEGGVCTALPQERAFTRYWPPTGSGVFPGSAALHTTRAVSPPRGCPGGEILYEVDFGTIACVPEAPTDCPPATRPVYDEGAWVCVPCNVLVQFGYLFDFERACASEPTLSCPDGRVPTFDETLREWLCAPTCTNTTYDRAFSNGVLVCVPC